METVPGWRVNERKTYPAATRDQILAALRDQAEDGIGLSAPAWARRVASPGPGAIKAKFGSWTGALEAAGLEPPLAAKVRRGRERREAAEARAREQTAAPKRAAWKQHKREKSLARIAEDQRDGRLTVRSVTPADLAALDAARARRQKRFTPTRSELARSVAAGAVA